MARVSKDHIDLFFEHGVEMDSRTIYIGSKIHEDGQENGIDHLVAEQFIKGMHLLETAAQDKPINIILNTPGGDCYHGMAIYDTIKSSPCPITITVRGNATSMGCIILQAADEGGRILSEHSCVMFHEGYDGYASNHPEIIRRWVEYNKKFGDRLDNVLYERIIEKHPEMKLKKFKELNVFDTILDAQGAIDLGLADRIIE